MIISHDREFIFLKTHKTAGTSLEFTLSGACGPRDVITPTLPIEDERMRLGRRPQNYVREGPGDRPLRADGLPTPDESVDFYNHMPAATVRDYVGDGVWGRYLKAGFVRNPWDREVSRFIFRERRAGIEPRFDRFGRWLRKAEAGGREWDIISLDDRLILDFVGRYETIEEDLARLLKTVGHDRPLTLARAKTQFRRAGERDYRRYFDAESRDFVARTQARIIETFGYEF
jgi:hypothetical protein